MDDLKALVGELVQLNDDNLARAVVDSNDVQLCLSELWDMLNTDFVPVVRCRGCKHWDDDPDTYGADDGPKGKCMKSFETMHADDFCSYGERKDGGG